MGFNSIEYANNYIKEKYDTVKVTMPKGMKDIIKAKAAEEGLSTNEWIRRAIHEKLSDNSGGG